MSTPEPPGPPWSQPGDGAAVPPPPPPPPPVPPGGGYPPAYPPAGYPPAFPPVPRSSGRAIAVMVLGIVGLVMMCGYGLGIIPAIIALALAPGAKREIESSRGMVTGDGFVKAGVICSWITVGLVVAGIVLIVLLLVLGAATSSSFESTNTDIGNATGLGLALAALPQWRRLRALPKES